MVSFLSSHYNAPGHVVLRLFPHVTSSALKRWRSERDPDASDDIVAGAGLGGLLPHTRREWNVAEPADVDDALAAIHTVVLPWFERFEDHRGLVDALCGAGVATMDGPRAVEYLLCFEGPDAAARAVDAYLARHTDELVRFWAFVHRFRREGDMETYAGSSGEIEDLARLVVGEDVAVAGPEMADAPELAEPPGPQRGRLIASSADIAADLSSYGEDEVARRVPSLDDQELERLYELASDHADTGMLFAKALALAAVEIVEGRGRPLRRSRRKSRPG